MTPAKPKPKAPTASTEALGAKDNATLTTKQPAAATPTVKKPDTQQAQKAVPQWEDSAAFTPALDPEEDAGVAAKAAGANDKATLMTTKPAAATPTVKKPDTQQAQKAVPQWEDSAAFTPAIAPEEDAGAATEASKFHANDNVEDSLSRTAADFGLVRDDDTAQQATAPDLSEGVITVEDRFQEDELTTTESEDVPEADPFNAVVEWLLLSPDQDD